MIGKGNWYDRVTSDFVQRVANIYLQEAGIPAFSIFPEIKSTKLTGNIAKYDKEDWFYIGNVSDYIRKGATESAGDDYETSTQPYSLIQYSFHKDMTKEETDQYDSPFNATQDAVKFVINRLRRMITQHLVSSYLTTGIWSADLTGTTDFTKWSNSSSTPLSDILTWKENIHKVTGFWPNRLIVTPDVHRTLRTNSDVLSYMSDSSDKKVTMQSMANFFELDSYVVIDTINSGATGYMADDRALLCFTPNNPSIMEPSAGYTITYQYSQNPLNATATRRIPLEIKNNALRIEADVYADPIVLGSDLGVYISDLI